MISYQCKGGGFPHIQNSTSTVWDTALISHALQSAGADVESPKLAESTRYLLSRQHIRFGDWASECPQTIPGGWGFSDINTMNPDVDDTTAALRAIKAAALKNPYTRQSWDRGMNWILAMQNPDGGWPAFEKNKGKEILSWVPMDGAEDAALDKSCADLTGRTLEFLGNDAGLRKENPKINKGIHWLESNQEKNGSWYGKWGICYIYGTWAAVTGLTAVRVHPERPALVKAQKWLLSIQNSDGGWGESCLSDKEKRYIPLGESTPSQTAWALDALISLSDRPSKEIDKGVEALVKLVNSSGWWMEYPTGSGLPGRFYINYHSYKYIWPLITLSNYYHKFIEKRNNS